MRLSSFLYNLDLNLETFASIFFNLCPFLWFPAWSDNQQNCLNLLSLRLKSAIGQKHVACDLCGNLSRRSENLHLMVFWSASMTVAYLCINLLTDLLIGQRHEFVSWCEDTLHQTSLSFQLIVFRRSQSQIGKTTESCTTHFHCQSCVLLKNPYVSRQDICLPKNHVLASWHNAWISLFLPRVSISKLPHAGKHG